MFSLNRAQIIGNLTRDPEMRYLPSGQPVTTFGVATNRRWVTATGEQQEDTQFHNIVVWRKLAEICHQILKKGDKVYIEGRLQTRGWEAPDGTKRQRTEIVMDNFVSLSPKSKIEREISVQSTDETVSPPTEKIPAPKPAKTAEEKKIEEINLDEIPF